MSVNELLYICYQYTNVDKGQCPGRLKLYVLYSVW